MILALLLAVPHLVYGVHGTPGALYVLGCEQQAIAWDNLSGAGTLAFSAVPCSVGASISWVADPGGGPADVPAPPVGPPPDSAPPPKGSGCGHLGLEVGALGLLMRRRHA